MTRDPAEFEWHCWSNTAHPPPSSITYVTSKMPAPLLPLSQGCLYKATPWQQQMPIKTASQSFATHSFPSTLTCLPQIHPPIIQGSLYSIHPPEPRPPSSTSPVNFCIHYLFQQSFTIHPFHMTEPSQNIHIYSSRQFSPRTCPRSHYFIPNPIQLRYTSRIHK